MSAVRAAQHEAERLLHDGWPFDLIEEWIERQSLSEDERSAVWLLAFLTPREGRRAPAPARPYSGVV